MLVKHKALDFRQFLLIVYWVFMVPTLISIAHFSYIRTFLTNSFVCRRFSSREYYTWDTLESNLPRSCFYSSIPEPTWMVCECLSIVFFQK